MALTLSHYRFGIDSGTESTHGWHANEDTNPSPGTIALDTTFLLRFCVQANTTGLSNVDNEFQYRINGGTWTNITTTSSVVRAVAATALTNGSNCTRRLSGTGTFESSAAGQTEDGTSGGTSNDIVASGNSETECGLQIRGVDTSPGDVIEFRLTRDGGTLLDTYAVTPTLIVAGVVAIVGTIAGTCTVAGAIDGLGACAGTSAGSCTTTGDLTEQASTSPIAGAIAGTSSTSAALVGRGACTGTIAGTCSTSASLTGDGVLVGTVSGACAVAGAMLGHGALAGTSAGTSAAAGTLGQQAAQITGAAAGVCVVSGACTGRGSVAAVVPCTGGASGLCTGRGACVGAITSMAAAAALLLGIGALAGASAGSSTAILQIGAPTHCHRSGSGGFFGMGW